MGEALSLTYLSPYDPFTAVTGAEISTRILATEMARRGHDVTVLHSYVSEAHRFLRDGVLCCGVSNNRLPYVAGWSAVRALSSALKTRRDVSSEGVLDARGGGVGTVLRRGGSRWGLSVFHPVDVVLDELEALPLKSVIRSAPRDLALAYGESVSVRSADWIVVETNSGGSAISRRYPWAAGKWTAIPSALPASWKPWKESWYDPFHFLFIGAGPRRATELFLLALRILGRDGLEVKATILRENRPRIRAMASRWNLNVRFSSQLPEAELRKAMAESCAYVLPSYREGYCRTVVEAAFHGTPSMVSNLSSVKEFVVDGSNGLVIDSWEPDVWAASLRRLIQDSGLRNRLGSAAKSRAEQAYTSDKIGALVERGYREGLSRQITDQTVRRAE